MFSGMLKLPTCWNIALSDQLHHNGPLCGSQQNTESVTLIERETCTTKRNSTTEKEKRITENCSDGRLRKSDKTYVLHRRAVIEQIQGDAGGVHPELSTVVPSFRHVASNLDVSELLPSTFSLRSVLPYFRTVFYDSTKIHTKIQSINPSFHTLEETRNREARTQDAG